MRSQETSLQVL